MSQQKAQLISPIDTFTPPGLNVSGVVTSTSFVGSGGTVTGLSGTPNITLGVVTATTYSGDGSNLTGVGSSAFIGVVTAAQSGTTTIDLSLGNTIYFTQDTDTTVAFANTEAVQKLKFIRVKDDTTTPRTITWPSSIIWDGGTAPTLIDSSSADDVQIFNLTTRDQGVTWYGYEAMKNDPAEPEFEGTLWAWGSNSQGQISEDLVSRSSPYQIPGTQWTSEFKNSPISKKSDGTLWAWGFNANGHLGLNDIANRSSPTQIPGTQWSSVSKGSRRIQAAFKTDGTLWTWGDNSQGKLSLNDTINRSSPTQVPGTSWAYHSGGESHGYATKTDGTLWFFGRGNSGSSGLNLGGAYRSSPTQIPGTQWSRPYASIGSYCGYFIKNDGTLWSVGENNFGQLAAGDQVNRSSPYQIPGTQWTHISGGTQGTIGVKSDGTLWSWGTGNAGANGQNDTIPRSSPTQVPGTQWTNNAIQDFYNVVATKSDGTLWTFGSLSGGRGGVNDNVQRSSPIQIPGTQWVNVCATANSFGVMATKNN